MPNELKQGEVLTGDDWDSAVFEALTAATWGEPVTWIGGEALYIKVGTRKPVQLAPNADRLEMECLWRGNLELHQETVTRSAHHWIVTYLLTYPGGSVRLRYVQPSDGTTGWFDLLED